ncbi:MAG TPA: hypothetical protein PKO25_01410 [Spirochaetota bacterium]|jgi:hypothetical protein|nr:hypothetical protein [Spirochaetota bacterium]OPZ39420.1 MAG: hypothetical protein BWY96_00251 [Spirochaetes bacterium ADurb.BinA120]HNU90512.1 hypothetical protein [Spirochaetota bacterium]HPI15642.1 hypothetical protein [Spirochaetota bacterium]HPV96494.1 hypothetical protein [Spirochaetota bacterium]
MESAFYSLATRSNFNKALNHFFKVNEIVDYLDSKRNLADVINADLDQNEILTDQILPIVGAVIRDKYQYSYDSYNVHDTVTDFTKISAETAKWTALDILIVYYTPSGETTLVNPKNQAHWERVRELGKDQAMVIYARHLKEPKDSKIEQEAIAAIEEMISGKDVFINKEFIDQTVAPKVEAPRPTPQAAAVAAGQRRMTPKYSVQVTNELFHNGNVEAWKRIIESYKVSHPDLEVMIFYENELINDINTLFKWGKVKTGGLIFFQISGENIRNVSKLQKYLFEGASPRFEQFLKLGVGKVLKLF